MKENDSFSFKLQANCMSYKRFTSLLHEKSLWSLQEDISKLLPAWELTHSGTLVKGWFLWIILRNFVNSSMMNSTDSPSWTLGYSQGKVYHKFEHFIWWWGYRKCKHMCRFGWMWLCVGVVTCLGVSLFFCGCTMNAIKNQNMSMQPTNVKTCLALHHCWYDKAHVYIHHVYDEIPPVW